MATETATAASAPPPSGDSATPAPAAAASPVTEPAATADVAAAAANGNGNSPSSSPKKATPKSSPSKQRRIPDSESKSIVASGGNREGMRRDRKKVERLSEVIDRQFQQAVDNRVALPQGHGAKLKDCPRVLYFMYMSKPEDLKLLHALVFNRAGKASEVRKNLLEFSGFDFDKSAKEFEKLVERASARKKKELKKSLYALDLERKQGDSQHEMAERLCKFLVKPFDNGKKPPKKLSFQKMQERRGRPSASGTASKKAGKKAKKSPAGGKKKSSAAAATSDSDDDVDEDDEKVAMETDEDAADSERMSSGSSDSDSDKSDSDDGEAKKKAKKKQQKQKTKEKDTKKKTPAKKPKASPGKKPATPASRKRKAASDSDDDAKPKSKQTAAAAISSDDDDDVPLKKLVKVAPKPPSDDEIKRAAVDVIAKADIDNLTVSSAIKQVCSKFLPVDISDRRDFIKAAIKQAMNDD